MFIGSPKEYMFNLMYAFTSFLKSIIGWFLPKPIVYPVDSNYAKLSFDVISSAATFALNKMKDDGWEKWFVDEQDCDDYAPKMRSEMVKYLQDNGHISKTASPVWMFGYTTDGGGKHVCIRCCADDKMYYWQPYPWCGTEPMKLTRTEINSASFVF